MQMQPRERAQSLYALWRGAEGLDADTLSELDTIQNDEAEILDRFYCDLSFGTAGLRGVLGAGSNRMNAYIVRQATQGYAQYLLGVPGAAQAGVAIAYDTRRKSDVFAKEAAGVLCANGIKVLLYEHVCSVPQLSYTILQKRCAGGILITASHNPPQYNGYKVYGPFGAQLSPGDSVAVEQAIKAVDVFTGVKSIPLDDAEEQGLLTYLGAELDAAFLKEVEGLTVNMDELAPIAAELQIIYTPLNGVGNIPVRTALRDSGFACVHVVPEQENPDPDFTTLKAPNPEERSSFVLAMRLAEQNSADLILATDPDSDRLGVAARAGNGQFAILTGNQLACLMMDYLLKQRSAQGMLPKNGLCVKSIVSTDMADAIASKHGAAMRDVLTGFRYIGELVQQCVDTKENTFLFGFEESYGYLFGPHCRDKDAIGAALVLCETAAHLRKEGKTLLQGMADLYRTYGMYEEAVLSFTLSGVEGMSKIQSFMQAMREQNLNEIFGKKVVATRDYKTGVRIDHITGKQTPTGLNESDVLYYELADNSFFVVRPSGTEPKLKAYLSTVIPQSSVAIDDFADTFAQTGNPSVVLRARKEAAEQFLKPYLGL